MTARGEWQDVSAATSRWGAQGPRYRRRRPLPALLVLGLLVVLSGLMWTRVFETTEDVETATRCTVPGAPTAPPEPDADPQQEPPALGQMLPRDALDRTNPIPAHDVKVRVLNGNGEANQAGLISQELTNYGFAPGGEPDNDPVYPNYDLDCHGQIRFGAAGASAARTLSLMVPCAQLVRDDRNGDTLDLALGKDFRDIRNKPEARQILQELKNREPQGAAEQEVRAPQIDEELLEAARDVAC
ncbi:MULTISPECIES: envelope integrity protein Cei [Saccharopolyspora]|uniref:envelope integrity protein Cei n=1 Tax=Saccharopolyspora TaxID=1835 RepID=UPI001CD3947E|nr:MULTISPECIES: envelope integrity protein Cei [Saccharopolyspora]MCA1186102.1 envelope integrity protein Cei [Saccharopolyspora sp. 6T]MCA1193138.1 envelope integrity protein Cei [Saccharopolyspora sp. 6V]MCA1224557.1 envelope integrity protein Cei [Saccharopolyspora sp. 6M]MCA1279028.1 envelope integrity protein Cei [Saccharopolyspora sp. 7B]